MRTTLTNIFHHHSINILSDNPLVSQARPLFFLLHWVGETQYKKEKSSLACETNSLYVTQSDKIDLIAENYMCSVYGVYQLICGCYLNIVCFIQFLRIFCIYGKDVIKMLCLEK